MTDNFSNDENALFKAQIREQDLAANQKLQETQGAADELARQAIIDKLKQAEVEHEKLKLKLEQEAYDGFEDILSHVKLNAAENEDNFTSGIDVLLAKLFKFFNFMDSELRVETDPQVYSMIRKREEAEKEAWVMAIIKLLRDKFNKLIKAIFSRDLSFQQKIDQEIERLFKRLFENDLSQEEEVAILERLEALRDLKLKLQIFAVGAVIAIFAELFSVELKASVETTKEEGKEKTSAKEATKEVREDLEIKVDAKEKPTVTVPVSLFDFSSGVAKPIPLTKPELDLLSDPLKNLMRPVPNPAINNKNREVKEKQEVEKDKQARKSEEPKKNGHLTEMSGKKKLEEQRKKQPYECSNHKKMNKNPDAYEESVTDCGFNFASMNTWKGAEYEPKQSSVNNAQENPRSKVTDILEERAGQSRKASLRDR